MTKRLMNSYAYLVKRKGTYAVTLTRINNDVNGNPRYQADIIDLDFLTKANTACSARYTFTGHHMSEQEEAEWIVDYHINW